MVASGPANCMGCFNGVFEFSKQNRDEVRQHHNAAAASVCGARPKQTNCLSGLKKSLVQPVASTFSSVCGVVGRVYNYLLPVTEPDALEKQLEETCLSMLGAPLEDVTVIGADLVDIDCRPGTGLRKLFVAACRKGAHKAHELRACHDTCSYRFDHWGKSGDRRRDLLALPRRLRMPRTTVQPRHDQPSHSDMAKFLLRSRRWKRGIYDVIPATAVPWLMLVPACLACTQARATTVAVVALPFIATATLAVTHKVARSFSQRD